jgi:hypothetical protein
MAPVQLTDYGKLNTNSDSKLSSYFISFFNDLSMLIFFARAGVITDKEILPITRLNFGRTQLDTSSGVHTLGRFECSGQMSETGMTSSCQDLWRKGHTLSGLYSVMGTAMIETVYCDFTKLPSDPGIKCFNTSPRFVVLVSNL